MKNRTDLKHYTNTTMLSLFLLDCHRRRWRRHKKDQRELYGLVHSVTLCHSYNYYSSSVFFTILHWATIITIADATYVVARQKLFTITREWDHRHQPNQTNQATSTRKTTTRHFLLFKPIMIVKRTLRRMWMRLCVCVCKHVYVEMRMRK